MMHTSFQIHTEFKMQVDEVCQWCVNAVFIAFSLCVSVYMHLCVCANVCACACVCVSVCPCMSASVCMTMHISVYISHEF